MATNPFGLPSSGFGFHDDDKEPRKQFAQRDRQKIWNDQFGIKIDRAKCPICNKNEISRHHFAIGHKKALAKDGTNSFRNVKPICHQCNSEMGTMNMSDYKRKYHSHSIKSTTKSTTKSKEKSVKRSVKKPLKKNVKRKTTK